jgi:excisionase family DNA binding protein
VASLLDAEAPPPAVRPSRRKIMADFVPGKTADSIALPIEEACKLSSLGRTKFYELLKSKKITARKVGRRTIVLRSEFEKELESLPVAGRAS